MPFNLQLGISLVVSIGADIKPPQWRRDWIYATTLDKDRYPDISIVSERR